MYTIYTNIKSEKFRASFIALCLQFFLEYSEKSDFFS